MFRDDAETDWKAIEECTQAVLRDDDKNEIVPIPRIKKLAWFVEDCHHQIRVKAPEAGRCLKEPKAIVGSEDWESWIAKHCRFSVATADRYIREHGRREGDA
jgi:hypothetical protein